jgi:glutamyl-tRNA synthetase/nondiscriminating glutamyl-tRNA synthetase
MKWVNGNKIKSMDLSDFYESISEYLKKYKSDFYNQFYSSVSKEYNEKILTELQSRIIKYDEFPVLTKFFYQDF